MNIKITAIELAIEITPYNEAGQVMPRPKPQPLVFYESQIPGPVMEWLRSLLPKEG